MEHFGPDHIGALLVTAVLAIVFFVIGRSARDTGRAARILGWAILVASVSTPYAHALEGRLNFRNTLPLEICDGATLAAVVALLTRNAFAFELTYLWGLGLSSQGLVSPVSSGAFPEVTYFRYWVIHSGIVIAALYLGPARGMPLRPGAFKRATAIALAWLAVAAVADWLLDANYMFLREKPPHSGMDNLGPWPWYVLVVTALAIAVMGLLTLLFRIWRWDRRPGAKS